jgi:beta-glucosidase
MTFPENFLWGVATAAYQIEGAVNEDYRGCSIWDTFSHSPGKTLHGDTGDIADDHYHHLEDDLNLMARIGVKAYRFSVSWPRIQPDGRGPVNRRGVDFYRRLLDGLHARSITPMLTIYHWDLPQALEDRGGWPARDTALRFAEYADLLFDVFGDAVPLWATINEPWVVAWLGYGLGEHAPGLHDTRRALAAAHHLLLGHGWAVEAFRAHGLRDSHIGIALNLAPARPVSTMASDLEAACLLDGSQNRWFLDPLLDSRYPADMLHHYAPWWDPKLVRDTDLQVMGTPIDFLGVNYYMRNAVRAGAGDADGLGINAVVTVPEGIATTAMGWGIEPEGLSDLLIRLAEDYPTIPPIFITENGGAFNDYVDPEGGVDDWERIAFLEGHIRALESALRAGVDIRGYFVWSLLDNFEWACGYSKRFGLVYVDYPTRLRIPKASAAWYARVIRANSLLPTQRIT